MPELNSKEKQVIGIADATAEALFGLKPESPLFRRQLEASNRLQGSTDLLDWIDALEGAEQDLKAVEGVEDEAFATYLKAFLRLGEEIRYVEGLRAKVRKMIAEGRR